MLETLGITYLRFTYRRNLWQKLKKQATSPNRKYTAVLKINK